MKGHNLISAFVAILLLFGAVLANDQEVDEEKDIECCQCYGRCSDGSFLLNTYPGESPNYFDCLNKCLTYSDPNNPLAECRFFTHNYASPNNCYLFSNCPTLDGSCLTCISGDAGCDPLECNLFGKQCQGTFVGQASADSQLQCACICDDERDCNYYTFDVEFSLCYLFATCDSYQDCPACVTGDEQCWQTLGGDCSLAPTPAPTSSPTTVTTTMTTAECPEGWMWNPDFGKCYFYIDEVMTWSEANERCAALDPDATLTSVRSQEENEYVFSLIDNSAWVGANDQAEESVWRWAQDGSLVEEDGSSYTNWFEGFGGEPNGGVRENCMELRYLDGTWNDLSCDNPNLAAVCCKPIASTAATAAHNITHV